MLITTLAVLLLLYGLTPRGTLLHEAIHLPWFWLRALVSSKYPTAAVKVPYGPHARQYYLLCLPPDGVVNRKSILIYFHGGSWRWGKPELFKAHAGFFNRLGFAVVLPAYRPCPKHDCRHIRDDVKAMLAQVHEQVKEKGLPCQRAITGGMSAGGHLAVLSALSTAWQPAQLPAQWIKGSFALAAPLHLSAMPHSFAVEDFAGPRHEPLFEQASPYSYAKKRTGLPILVVHGTHDGMVPYHSTSGFVRRRRLLPATPLTFVKINKGTHLKVASWIFRRGKTRAALKDWLAAHAAD